MKININSYRLLVALCSLITASVYAVPTIPPQNNPPAAASYSKVAPDWRVSSVYGPRLTSGSKFHKGIDYNQQSGDGDLGVLLKARAAGKIAEIKQGLFRIVSPTHSFDYIHIFDQATVSNPNTIAAGYSKVVLGSINNNAGTGTCNAVFFYDIQNKLAKILTKKSCSKYTKTVNGNTVKAQVVVVAEEPIATMGKAGTDNAHLHLQLNAGADSALTKITHSPALIAGKSERFQVKLVQDTFTDQVLQAMTNGQGFAIEVTENSLVPVLDTITVSPPGAPVTFSFGGKIEENPKNVSKDNIVPTLDLTKGSSTPKIKPKFWGEMGTPRTMTFFVPYSEFAALADGPHGFFVTITTIDYEQATKELIFIKNPRFIKIANNGKELPYSAVLGNQPNDWACVKDTTTGLIWEIKTDDGGLRDRYRVYSWYDPQYLPDAFYKYGYYDVEHDADHIWAGWKNPEKSPYGDGATNKDLCNAEPANCNTYAYTKAVNAKTLCAANDWRMPSKEELIVVSIPMYEYFFYDYDSWWFWSSSLVAYSGESAWNVAFPYGNSLGIGKDRTFSVLLVRSGQ